LVSLLLVRPAGRRKPAADDGMDAIIVSVIIELHRAEQIAVIGHRDGGHLLLLGELHQLRNFARAVEQRIIGVTVKMNERTRHR